MSTKFIEQGIENPGGIDLDLHPIAVAHPQIGETEEPFGEGKSILNPPTAAVEFTDEMRR